MRYSPLRYPGGKGKISKFMKEFVASNFSKEPCYIEPYVGGAEIALTLLLENYVSEIYINDKDYGIYCFWKSILKNTDDFIKLIESTPVNIETWKNQKNIYKNQDKYTDIEIGFATFFLNRCNYSGVIKGGPIGGISQKGKWKIDARYNKEYLIKKIKKIAEYKEKIHLYNEDTLYFLMEHKEKVQKCLLYLDPPYYIKGYQLYTNHYIKSDHIAIANCVKNLQGTWIVSYDNTPEIVDLYKFVNSKKIREFNISYSAGKNKLGREIMFFSKNSLIPDCAIC